MEDPVAKRSHHKKKKKRSRHSSVSSQSSGSDGGEMSRKHMKAEHKRKREKSRRPEEGAYRSEERTKEKSRSGTHGHDKPRSDRPDYRKREVSPSAGERRHGRDERDRHKERGSRWEDEEHRYNSNSRRVKQEPQSDDEDQPRRGHRHHDNQSDGRREDNRDNQARGQNEGGFQDRRGRGGRPWGRGRGGGRGRGRGRGGGGGEEEFQWGRADQQSEQQASGPKVEKEKPNFGLSGKLTEDVNTINGVVIKYTEPPEARKPKRRWRLYVFKGDETLPTLYIHRQSAYLMGRDRKIADIPLDHPSVSKQHAALQYRLVTFKRLDGISTGKCIRPYIIDLESANGTYVNNKKIESKKYVEIMEKDVLKFGYSSREYVLLHEHSQDTNSGDDDDVKEEGPNP